MLKKSYEEFYNQTITKIAKDKIFAQLNTACIKSNRTSNQTDKNLLKTLISNIVYKVSDKNFGFIDDPQQRIYTVPRLE